MFSIQGIDHIVLRTNCLKEMLHFYCDILGANIEKKQEQYHLTQLRIGDNLIDLVDVNGKIDMENKNLAHFCLRIKPFDYEKLNTYFKQHNIETLRFGHRYSSQGMGDSFYLHDPQGNEIELCEAK